MPTLPWSTVDATATGEVLVMASRFRLRRFRHVLPFFLDALRILAQVRSADGAVGVTLQAHPLRREFLTLSVWRDQAAIDALVRAEPHRTIMGRYRAACEASEFTFWTVGATELPVSWTDARGRLTG